jgi:hypothetical protein
LMNLNHTEIEADFRGQNEIGPWFLEGCRLHIRSLLTSDGRICLAIVEKRFDTPWKNMASESPRWESETQLLFTKCGPIFWRIRRGQCLSDRERATLRYAARSRIPKRACDFPIRRGPSQGLPAFGNAVIWPFLLLDSVTVLSLCRSITIIPDLIWTMNQEKKQMISMFRTGRVRFSLGHVLSPCCLSHLIWVLVYLFTAMPFWYLFLFSFSYPFRYPIIWILFIFWIEALSTCLWVIIFVIRMSFLLPGVIPYFTVRPLLFC